MRNKRLFLVGAVLVACWLLAVASFARPVMAQDNLLSNPSFEGAYSSFVPNPPISDCSLGVCTTAQMAAGWWPWWVSQTGSDQPWQNRMPEYKPAEAPYNNRIRSGTRAQQYFTFHSTHTAGLWQRVNVPANARVQFSIWGMAWSTTDDDPAFSNYPSVVNMRIGIDPTGGTNPFSPAIVWSGTANQYDSYALFSVEAQAQGDAVTVFTYSNPVEARKHNDIYWDDASLVVTGAGAPVIPAGGAGNTGSTTNPTQLGPTPTPNADGVILVIVQSGDTLWSVAARAGLTLDELLDLNNLTRDSFIQPGQELIIGHGDANAAAPTGEGGGGVEETAAITTTVTTTETVPVEPTATPEIEPTPAPTEAPVVSEPEVTGGSICLTAFDDANRNGLRDSGEGLRNAVAFTVTNADTQTVASNYITDATTESYCIEGLEPGNYLVARSIQTNEKMTTPDNWGVAIVAGAATTLSFGSFIDDTPPTAVAEAQPDTAAASEETANTTTSEGALTEAETPEEEGGGGLITGIVIAVVVLAVLLLVGVLAVILSARRNTV